MLPPVCNLVNDSSNQVKEVLNRVNEVANKVEEVHKELHEIKEFTTTSFICNISRNPLEEVSKKVNEVANKVEEVHKDLHEINEFITTSFTCNISRNPLEEVSNKENEARSMGFNLIVPSPVNSLDLMQSEVPYQSVGRPEKKKSQTAGIALDRRNNEDWTILQPISSRYHSFPDMDQSNVVVLSDSLIELGLSENDTDTKSIRSEQAQSDSDKRSDLRFIVELNGPEYQSDQMNPEVTPSDVTDIPKSVSSGSNEVEDKTAIKKEIEPSLSQSLEKEDLKNDVLSQENREEKDSEEWRGFYSKLDDNRKIWENDFSMMKNLPPLQPNELEWVIEDFFQFRDPNAEYYLRSPAKTYNSITFRLRVYPLNPKPEPGGVSIFLVVDPGDCFPSHANQWNMQKSDYQIAAFSWKNWRKNSIIGKESFAFCASSKSWGWREFIPKERLEPGDLLGPDGQLVLRAQLYPKPAEVNIHSESLREFGYLGIRKQAAACYLNSLVQSLFYIGKFREGVFKLTTDKDKKVIDSFESFVGPLPDRSSTNEKEEAKDSSQPSDKTRSTDDEINAAFDGSRDTSSALEVLFLHLHWANDIASTDDLFKSFGLDSNESLTQYDARKLNRLLCNRLEEKMKGTSMEGAIERLFMGEMESYIECVNMKYVSSIKKPFFNLQLNVKDNQNLLQSLRKYTAEEMLEGDNAYDAEEYGKQPARKRIRFLRFPPVLLFHLNRFTFDPTQKETIKVNQYFEYPEILDLDEILPGSGKYELFCVIVHSGDFVDGHYYVINRPGGGRFWIKFDDEKVYPVSPNSALADCFGGHKEVCYDYTIAPDGSSRGSGEGKPSHSPVKSHSAYMLFYVKCDLASEILAEPIPEEANAHLLKRILCEQNQKKNRMLLGQSVESKV